MYQELATVCLGGGERCTIIGLRWRNSPMCTLSQHGYGVRFEGVPEPTPEQHEAKAALQVCSWPAKTGEVCYTQPWPACPFSA